MSQKKTIPKSLKNWFVFHFFVDILFAIPLMFFPEQFLGMLGWEQVDIVTARLVAAALFAIGIESWLARNASVESYKSMLQLKILWSAAAVVAIGISIWELQSQNIFLWGILGIFIVFHIVWGYWYNVLEK